MKLILNIDASTVPVKDVSYTNGRRNPVEAVRPLVAVQAVRGAGLKVRSAKVHARAETPVLVIEAEYDGLDGVHGVVRRLARTLNQQSILLYKVERQMGVELGQEIDADVAGFAACNFILPNGLRLSSTFEVQA